MRNKSFSTSKGGFTLLEIIVVVAIITILAGILAPVIRDTLEDARVGKVVSTFDAMKKACMKYWYDTDVLPADANALLVAGGVNNWSGPYLDAEFTNAMNPWGTATMAATLTGGTTASSGSSDGYVIAGAAATGVVAGVELVFATVPIAMARAIDNAIDGTAAGAETPAVGMVEFDNTSVTTTEVRIMLFIQQ